MAVAVGFFGTTVLTGSGWRSWMILSTFFAESAVLCWLTGGSFGQLICRGGAVWRAAGGVGSVTGRVGVIRLARVPIGLPRSVLRAALVSLALPPLIVGAD